MLEKIVMDNYTTFINETAVDFGATSYKFLSENVENKILKGCLFVGENASGKTKILLSIKFLLDFLFKDQNVDFLSNKSFYTSKNGYKLGYFFNVLNNKISYNLEMNIEGFISEKLTLNDKVIIERLGNTAKLFLNEEKIFDDISTNLSFLRRVYFDTKFYNNEILNTWFDYLKNSVYVNCNTRNIVTYSGESLLAHDYLSREDVTEINKVLKKINYKETIKFSSSMNITKGISFRLNDNKKIILFNKEGTKVFIPEIFESTGNITLMNLLPTFIHAINNKCIVILDEFSSGFHNELEECLVKYFFHYTNGSQLFFVSHSTNLLNNTILRPDQIYSVTFDGKNGSVVKRFSSEMPRESQNVEKMYLNGIFNGMPRYNKIFKD